MYVSDAYRAQDNVSDPLELELQRVVGCHTSAQSGTTLLWRAESALNH